MRWLTGRRTGEKSTRQGGWTDPSATAVATAAAALECSSGGARGRRRREGHLAPPPRLLLAPLSLGLLLLLVGALVGAEAGGGGSPPMPQRPPPLREDHAVVAVTVDGHVHTLDAWSGDVRGVYVDSGGPLVSSSTTVSDGGSSGSGRGSGEDSSGSENHNSAASGGDDDAGHGNRRPGADRQQQRYRNALGEGLVVPGLDGVIYSLGTDGRLSVLTSSAPDLVLEPRMACLAVNADSDGIVEDESCGLLIGEKTTELFSLDTETGTAQRVGGGVQNRPSSSREASDSGGGRGRGGGPDNIWSAAATVQGREGEGEGESGPWKWDYGSENRQQQRPPPPRPSNSNLLLQRDEYVVRALDAETSEELWFVTVAHFSALDLQGRGGATALTRATVAAADRDGYTRAVRARSTSSDDTDGFVKALPPPEEDENDLDRWDSRASSSSSSGGGGGWISRDDFERGIPGGDIDGAGGGGGVAGGKQARRRGKFGEEHADRFPYLLYEDNAHVVAMDPMDGSVLWRKEMPALAVSLYGIRGREWVDILPPPMSMLQPPPPAFYPSSSTLMQETSFDERSIRSSGDWLAGEMVDWSHDSDNGAGPLLLLTNGETKYLSDSEEDSASFSSDDASWGGDGDGGGGVLDADAYRSCRASSSGSSSGSSSCPGNKAEGNSCADVTTFDGAGTMVQAAVSRPPPRVGSDGGGGGGKMTGLLQPGLRQGKLHAQLGFLNGHFFVSSSLRRGPLHTAVEDPAVATQDRYPHPLGMAGRRSFVDAAGRDARDRVGDLGASAAAETMRGGLLQMPPPSQGKIPPHAARPIDQAGPKVFMVDDQIGTRLGTATAAVSGADGGGGSTQMGIGDWRKALLDRVEKEMMEERKSNMGTGSAGGVGIDPENRGLFFSWSSLALLVGGVVAIVALVAYMAYKHGATAMANMSTITRRGGSATKLGKNASPGAVGSDDGGRSGGKKCPVGTTAAATAAAATATEHPLSGDTSSSEQLFLPNAAHSPSLQHGASTSAMFVGSSRLNGFRPSEGMASFGRCSPTETVTLQRPRSMPEGGYIHRVHSLPALGQSSHSPPAREDDRFRHSQQEWHSLFGGSEGKTSSSAARGGRGDDHAGQLARAVSAAVGRTAAAPQIGNKRSSSGSGSGSGSSVGVYEEGGSAFSSAAPSPRPASATGTGTAPRESVREWGSGSRSSNGPAPTAAASSPLSQGQAQGQAAEVLEGFSPSPLASGAASATTEVLSREDWGNGSLKSRNDYFAAAADRSAVKAESTRRRRQRQGSCSISREPSSREDSENDDNHSDGDELRQRRRQRRQQQWRRPRSQTRRSQQDFSSDECGDESEDGGSGRRRKTPATASGGVRDRKESSSRRTSRSPRASIGSMEELVLDTGGGGGSGDPDSAVVDTGGDDKDALLVTNRRLRTEFVEGKKLGKGGFGTVFKCRNRLDGHDYAVKKIRLSSDPRWQPQLDKVLREVKIMSLLDHPNIVRYYQAWLEKFTDEDEELLREEGAPSAVSESWDQTTGGDSRPNSHLHHHHQHSKHTGTGTTTTATATNKTRTYANGGGGSGLRGGHLKGNGLRGLGSLGFGPSFPPNSPLFVTATAPDGGLRGAAAGAGHRSGRNGLLEIRGGGGGDDDETTASGGGEEDPPPWDNWPGSSAGGGGRYASKLAKPLFEEHSMDGWSVDSRNADGRENGGGWSSGRGGAGAGARRAWGDVSYSEEGDHEEDEDEDEASMPGFVFDREVSVSRDITRVEEKGGDGRGESAAGDDWLVGESDHEDGGGEYRQEEAGWTKVGERRPSSSVSMTATATASAYAEDQEGCSEGRVDTNIMHAAPPPLEGGISTRGGTRGNRGGESGWANRCPGGKGSADKNEEDFGSYGRVEHGRNDDDDDDDDESFGKDRTSLLPPAQENKCGGIDTTGSKRDGGGTGSSSPLPAAGSTYVELTLSNVPSNRPMARKDQGRRHGSRAGNKSDGEGKVVAADVAATKAAEAERKRRPRGKSWPQNAIAAVAAAAAAADDDDFDEDPAARTGGGVGSGGGAGRKTSLDARKWHARSSTAADADAALNHGRRKKSVGKGSWQKERGGGRRRSKEVYDLWLYIQMQYCSHNNLQFFLDEEPVRRGQTRVDMPQVMHVFMQVAKGLQYVHACGLIHRDLKPANCFLMRDGTVKIGDFGLSRHILPADGINGGAAAAAASPTAAASADAFAEGRHRASFAWESDHALGDALGDESITGGVGTYLYASPEQMSGKGYDEKTDVYSLGMLLFELCHPPFGTKMERTVVLMNAHRLQFPAGDVWGPPKGQEAMKNMCRSMLQEESGKRPSAADIVRQVELMQGKHMVLQLDKKPPASYGADGDDDGRPDMAVVLRVEALDQEGLLHRLVDRIRALCRGQAGHDAPAGAGGRGGGGGTEDGGGGGGEGAGAGAGGGGGGGGARLEQYGLRGHTGSAIMEFLIAGAKLEEREVIIAALESLPEVKTVREFPANG